MHLGSCVQVYMYVSDTSVAEMNLSLRLACLAWCALLLAVYALVQLCVQVHMHLYICVSDTSVAEMKQLLLVSATGLPGLVRVPSGSVHLYIVDAYSPCASVQAGRDRSMPGARQPRLSACKRRVRVELT